MIKFEKTDTYGWKAAIRGMRNPMNSWDKSDSYCTYLVDDEYDVEKEFEHFVGDSDMELMKNLFKAGTDHRKFMRMINVSVDITAPLYWWKEFDTYKVGTVANSCSTMHKITDKKFEISDFSSENLCGDYLRLLNDIIDAMNVARYNYINTKEKTYWWQIIQLLPTSYNQKRTIQMNYEVLANIYKSRKNHKLDEWRKFCDWAHDWLPYSELITGEFQDE